MDRFAYKIESPQAWADAVAAGTYLGSPLDRTDGFIHLSAKEQVRETLTKWFAGQGELILACIDLSVLGDHVRWEASRGGALFPHVYGPLPMHAVVETLVVPVSASGSHVLAETFP